CGNVQEYVQTITVRDTVAPIFVESLPADVNVSCDAVPTAETLTATDNCGSAIVIYDEVRIDGSCINSYILTRTWVATDACGNETRHTQVVTVEDVTAPVVSACINDSTIYTSSISCNISIPDFTSDTQLAVSDNCGTLMDGTIVVTQYPVAGSILEVGTHVVTIFATDVCNNVDSCQFIL